MDENIDFLFCSALPSPKRSHCSVGSTHPLVTSPGILRDAGIEIARDMKNIQFEETYDEWSRLLRESGLVHPLWNQEDCPPNPRRWSYFKKSCHSRDRVCGLPTSYWDSVILT